MSNPDNSGTVFAYSNIDGGRCVSNPYSIPVNMVKATQSEGRGLDAALQRVKKQIDKNRRPLFEMKSSHFYKENNGCRNITDLEKALKLQQCSLTKSDLRIIADSFPNEFGGIDYKMFTNRLYANEGHRGKFRNLRQEALKKSQFPPVESSANVSDQAYDDETQVATQQMVGITAVGKPQAY